MKVGENRKRTHEEFLEEMKILHPNLKILTKYKTAHIPILVQDEFGILQQSPNRLLSKRTPTIVSAIDKNKYYIKKAQKIHNYRYVYTFIKYINSFQKISILCNEHGIFKQTPSEHLNGAGCPKCGILKRSAQYKENPVGWNKTNWKRCEKSRFFDNYKVYIIECWNDDEKFYKIGRTCRTLKKRFESGFPYEYKCIYSITGNSVEIFNLESKLKRLNRDFKYIPKQNFGGKYECFSQVTLESIKYEQ